MAVDQSSGAIPPDYTQLTSVRVPLDQAADALVSPDASGRTPIVVLTRRQNRISSDAYRFVYSISASDFDQVFQAACQNTLRAMVRQISSDEVNNLTRRDTSELRDALSNASEPYGVKMVKVNIIYAHPPVDFVRSQEARQLAMLQQAEQAEQQALLQRKQTDGETLARQAVIARVGRERDELQVQVQKAEIRRRVVELEAQAEELRISKLQERLNSYPRAAEWEWQGEQLEVVRGLASNTHAVVQMGGGSTDLAQAFSLRDSWQDQSVQANTDPTAPTRKTSSKSQQVHEK